MRDYFEPMLGATGALIAQFAITLFVILVLILIVFWLIRRFSGGRFGNGASRSRQPRLSVLDALPIDQRRRLILVRRDNVEHLILIGGPSDVVVEASIHRPPPGQRRSDAQMARPAPAVAQPPAAPAPAAAAPARPAQPPATEILRAAAMETRRAEAQPVTEPAEEPVDEYAVHRNEAPIAEAPAPLPEAAEPPQAPEPPPVRAPQPQPQKSARGMPSFLSGGRSRQTPVAPEPPAPRRDARPRPAEPARAAPPQGGSPFARESWQATEPARPAGRTSMPPAPPIEPSPFGDEPYGVPESAPSPALRFEPTGERDPAPETFVSEPARLPAVEKAVPDVEPPTSADQPISVDEAFDENAPILPHIEMPPEPEAEKPRPSQVGDLEKEMARLLGEISGSKR